MVLRSFTSGVDALNTSGFGGWRLRLLHEGGCFLFNSFAVYAQMLAPGTQSRVLFFFPVPEEHGGRLLAICSKFPGLVRFAPPSQVHTAVNGRRRKGRKAARNQQITQTNGMHGWWGANNICS